MPRHVPSPSHAEEPTEQVLVRLACDSVTAFMQHHARDVTRGGIFLVSPEVHPEGTLVVFAVELANGRRVLRGRGVVRWSRGAAGPTERPRLPGMGLQFAHLEADSRKLVELIVATRGPDGRSNEPPGPEACEEAFARAEFLEAPAGTSSPALSALPTPPRVAPLVAVPTIPPLAAPRPARPGASAAPHTPAPPQAGRRTPPGLDAPLPPRVPDVVPGTRTPPDARLPGASVRTSSRPQGVFVSSSTPPPEVIPLPAPAVSGPRPAGREPPPEARKEEVAPVEAEVSLDFSVGPWPERAPAPAVTPPPALEAAPTTPTEEEAPPPGGASTDSLGRAARAVEALRVSRAIEHLRKKNYARAEAELQTAVAQEPDNARLRFELGLVYSEWSDARTGNHDGAAEACFARAAELDPGFDQPLVHLGQVQLRRGLLEAAEASFREALRRDPHGRAAQEGLRLTRSMRSRQVALRYGLPAAAVVLVALGSLAYGLSLRGAPVAPEPLATSAAPASAGATPPAEASPRTPATATPPQAVAAVQPGGVQPGGVQPGGVQPGGVQPGGVQPGAVPAPTPQAAAAARASAGASPVAPAEPSAAHGEGGHAAAAAPAGKDVAPERRSRPSIARKAPARPEKPTGTAVSGGGGSAASWAKKGEAALRAGLVVEAEEAFSKALAADARHAPAHRGLGSVFLMQGRDAEAAKAFRQYLKLAPGAPDAARIQGVLQGL